MIRDAFPRGEAASAPIGAGGEIAWTVGPQIVTVRQQEGVLRRWIANVPEIGVM